MTALPLASRELKRLKKLAHGLKPVVRIGQNGLTEGVLRELNLALDHHQLVKMKLAGGDSDTRDQQVESLCENAGAIPVQRVGRTVTLFRRNPNKPPPGESPGSP